MGSTDEAVATGGCLCGAVRFQAIGAPLWSAHCHCESCRRHTSAAVATYVGFPTSRVSFSKGTPSSFRSSPPVQRSFCPHCGSPISYVSEQWPGETHLFWPSFDEPERFQPTRHAMFNERLPAFDIYDDLPRFAPGSSAPVAWGVKPAARILFLCTGNSARSILAEAIAGDLNATAGEQFLRAHSAGSHPRGEVDADTLAALRAHGHNVRSLRSKSWSEFSGSAAPVLRWVITLCDDAAAERCPTFREDSAHPMQTLHWSLPDPTTGAASFEDTYQALSQHIAHLLTDVLLANA
jgi:protein-tyrosine-phosphatase